MTKAKIALRARYTLEFKPEATRLVEGGDAHRSGRQAAGCGQSGPVNRDKANRQSKLTGVNSKPVSAEQMEIARLRAELARVTMERDMLRKATAYFSQKVRSEMCCLICLMLWLRIL